MVSWAGVKRGAREIGDSTAAVLGQAVFSTAVTVFLILSGYASRMGVQSLLMLSLSTGLLASKQKPDGRWLARGASLLAAGTAVALAFVVPRGASYAYPLTLVVGAGSWLLVGLVLLARGGAGTGLVRRRPDAWTWIVGALSWAAISITYSNQAFVASLGKAATYLWTPWALAAFLVTGLIVPRFVFQRWPPLVPATAKWAGGMAKGVVLGLGTSAAVAFFVLHAAPLIVPDLVQAPPCADCDPATFISAMQAFDSPQGEVVVAHFGAHPTGMLVHLGGFDAPLELRYADGQWFVLGNGHDIDSTTLSVSSQNETLIVVLQERALWHPVAVEGIGGNRLPVEGFYTPRALSTV